ncbi:hypothetical protein D3C81_2014190 [compost metagenome]
MIPQQHILGFDILRHYKGLDTIDTQLHKQIFCQRLNCLCSNPLAPKSIVKPVAYGDHIYILHIIKYFRHANNTFRLFVQADSQENHLFLKKISFKMSNHIGYSIFIFLQHYW